MAITYNEGSLEIRTPNLAMVIQNGLLEQIEVGAGRWLAQPLPLITLVYQGNSEEPFAVTEQSVELINDHCADVYYEGLAGHVGLRIEQYGDEVWMTPSAITTRRGLKAIRLNFGCAHQGKRVILPVFQGAQLDEQCTQLVNERLIWPNVWEAAIAFIESEAGECLYAWAEDRTDRFKGLMIKRTDGMIRLGLESENPGPLYDKQESGGQTWKFAVSPTGWRAGAERYADWLEHTWDLKRIRDRRAPWWEEISFHLCWCPPDPDILDALARRIAPAKVLLHVPQWRADAYDRNYPEYRASEQAARFFLKAKAMGFHIMPHFNVFSVSANHPLFELFQNHQLRDVDNHARMGWYYRYADRQVSGFPASVHAGKLADENILLAHIHMGLGRWRQEITARVAGVMQSEGLDAAFLDQTNCLWNQDNGIVEGLSNVQGVQLLLEQADRLVPGLIAGGEGLNEVCMRRQSFAQLHLFKSHHQTIEGLESIALRVSDYLYRGHCKFLGYHNMNGYTEESLLRMRVQEKLGGLPGLIIENADEINQPNAAMLREFERANSG